MKQLKSIFLLPALALLLLITSSRPLSAQGFLRAAGKEIVDGAGRSVLLRGMGLGGWMLQEPYMLQLSGAAINQADIRKKIEALIGHDRTVQFYDAWLTNFCRKTDIDSLAAWGFNSIRLPMHYNLFTLPVDEEPVTGKQTWLPKGFQLVDTLLSWCRSNHIYLILDLHAAPGGQGADRAISDRDTTKPSLWQSSANRAKTIALWKQLATRYANEPWIGGYDLINETNWGFQDPADKNGCAEATNAPLRQLLVDITAAIRTVDRNHLIFLEANCWGNNYKGILPAWDSNLAISFHKYWNDNNQGSIQQFIDMREQYKIPVWMGESGENSNSWFRSAISLLERNDIGWAWWPLKKMGMNNPFQVQSNDGYRALVAYWKGQGSKPSASDAFSALMELAASTRTERTIYHADVIDAMFRQVTRPEARPFALNHIGREAMLFAVNYDIGPLGEAYFSMDSANYRVSTGKDIPWNRGWTYRNDGIDIETCTDTASNGFQVDGLKSSEWLQYTVYAAQTGVYDLQVRVKSPAAATLALIVNQSAASRLDLAHGTSGWTSGRIPRISLRKGENKIRLAATSGELSLSYLQFTRQAGMPAGTN
ncbi:MAG: glycosyl hydrolase family 5 [Flaviaesturariibacter sp.]|nr:glycosyl hydrolase family 5 [Flaviaesturariibacter sp.]